MTQADRNTRVLIANSPLIDQVTLDYHGTHLTSGDVLRARAPCPCVSTAISLPNEISLLFLQQNCSLKFSGTRGYSAHEHTVLYSNARLSASTALPQDIVIEALVSLVLVSVGLVLGAPKLKPISWSQWAGEIEKEGGGRNPYRRLEERYNFWDVRVGANSLFDGVWSIRMFLTVPGQAERICGLGQG
ncbi:unnamed protein product [Aspergillus oryzae]|uniref:Unnamed protein product n=2 Tax=Aspergillus oryzae TaxID=5062 RepID=A0AAN5BQV1_ASPOZ|nr:unnamed protein product [Aspergillus oryzae]GMF93295.1 unnamed protein product [Aspergillus oryzae]GMG05627.1 unnamed protein product [Aspergillus oryzae]GMG28034.1 unnamed protein product [Aspergillus oryzae]GMG41407.1 unnamed protein product [Aspergillus oryzae var. brunneus]